MFEKLYFITGNQNKFDEVKLILPGIKQIQIDLDEIQEIDPHKVITHKLKTALKHHSGEFIIEDTSLFFECLQNKLPGPFIKWFLKSLGNQNLYEMTKKYNNFRATAKTIIGYANENLEFEFFEGSLTGTIVPPVGENGFAWDKIFIPDGCNKTMAQMTTDEKNKISMRTKALLKFEDFLSKKNLKQTINPISHPL
jgi:non-canonical purine NTP pyrophosphatase (RdgB/HAM1 family)